MAKISPVQFLRKIYSTILKYFIGLVLSGVLAISVIFFFLPFILLRRLVFHSAKLCRPDLGKMVDARGSLALIDDIYQSPRGKMVVGYPIEGCPSLEELRDAVKYTLEAKENDNLLHPELSQNVSNWLGFPFWTPIKNFHMDNQVSLCDFTSADQATVTEYMKARSLQAFNADEPLWKITLIPEYHPVTNTCSHYVLGSSYSFVVLEAHHSLVDGFSLMKLVFKFFKVSNKLPELTKSRKGLKSVGASLHIRLLSLLKVPFDIGEAFFKRSRDGDIWTVKENINLSSKLPMKPAQLNTYSSAASDLIPFSKIKEIRLKHKVSTLAVVSAAIGGAIRQTMFTEQKTIPRKLKFAVVLGLPDHPDKLRNHWTAAPIALPIGEPDPVTRLLRINCRLGQLKNSAIPSIAAQLGILFGSLPLPISRNCLLTPISSGHMAVLSSFPGPQDQMILFDSHKCPEGFGMCSGMMGTSALAFSFVTYAGYGRLMMGADTSIVTSDGQASSVTQEFTNQLDLLLRSKSQIPEFV